METIVAPGTVVDTTAVPGWTPVKVTAELAEPVVALDTNPLHMDGPLSWAGFLAHVDQHGRWSLPPVDDDQVVDFALPLATWTAPASTLAHDPAVAAAEPGYVWGWACSAAIYEPDGWCTVDVRRRPAAEPMARYSPDKTAHLSTGPLKARDVPHPATMVLQVTWWALAEPDRMEQMLNRVHGLGRMLHHGNGRVHAWHVEPDDRAEERWRWRHLPDPSGRTESIRAPYHHHSRRMPCAPIPEGASDAAD